MMAIEPGGDPAFSVSAQQAVDPYLRALRRHWRLVAIVCALALLAAGVTLARSGRSYSATASILVTPLPEGSAGFTGIGTVVDTGDPARTVQTAAALVDSANAAALAAKALGKPWTGPAVQKAVAVTPEGASDVLSVTATASSPSEAQRLADAFAKSAVRYRASVVQAQIAAALVSLESRISTLQKTEPTSAELTALSNAAGQLREVQGTGGDPALSVSQTAELPTSPNGASRFLILLLALVGGFAIASVAALGLETFSRPVRDREEIESLFPVPVLAALPAVRGGRRVHGVPPWALPPEAFEQLRMLRVQLALSPGGQVVMVTSAGAGDGKTTVTAALAAAFSEAGQSVILMDLDLRKPDLEPLLEIRASLDPADDHAPGAPLPVSKLPGVRVLPTPSGANISTIEVVVQRLPLLIAQARRTADVVLIDTAPVGEVSESLRIAAMADKLVFVARPRHTDRRRLLLARDLLARADVEPLGLVLVGRETGIPKADLGYAYSLGPVTGPTHRNGAPVPAPSPAAEADEVDVAPGAEHE